MLKGYTTIKSKRGEIIIPNDLATYLKENKVRAHINSDKSVELRGEQKQYHGRLHNQLGVKKFKDGNKCNFHKSNLVM